MPGAVFVQVHGEKMVEQTLRDVGLAATDMRPVWPTVIGHLEEIERQQFETRGARAGNRWADLDNYYMFRKFLRGQSLEVMKASEDLYQALTSQTGDSVRDAHDDYLVFGADLPQFGIHQDPPMDANFKIRYPVDLTEADRIDISNLIMEYVLESVNDAVPTKAPRGRAAFKTSPKTGRRYYAKRGAGGRFIPRSYG